jgi:predicted restriction endonuclease
MIVLCPNHHAMFDFGIPKFCDTKTIVIGGKVSQLTWKHELSAASTVYHNEKLYLRR